MVDLTDAEWPSLKQVGAVNPPTWEEPQPSLTLHPCWPDVTKTVTSLPGAASYTRLG